MSGDTSFADHKLCGFLCAVLTATDRDSDPAFAERCEIFSDGGEVGFRSQTGVVLSTVVNSSQCGGGGGGSKAKRTHSVGMVNGSMSVVHQLHAMVTRKCAKVDARVVCVESPRVVLLVDVYLPIQVWSGWQFPRSGAVAAAIFRHLREHLKHPFGEHQHIEKIEQPKSAPKLPNSQAPYNGDSTSIGNQRGF